MDYSLLVKALLKTLGIWKSGYDRLLDCIFYLPFGGEQRFRRGCLDFACIERGDKVLDLCCGSGVLTKLIAECLGYSGQVIGVDLSTSVLKEAKTLQNQRIAFTCACGENLPLRSSIFDKCFLSFGLHHMDKQARQKTLREVSRTLAPGGSLFVIEYNLPEKVKARLASRALVKLDASAEAYPMLMNGDLIKELQKAVLNINRRKFIGGDIIQLIEAGK